MSKTKSPPKVSQEFENFQRLARKLMAVPKKELDQKQAEYEHDRPKNHDRERIKK